MRRDTRSRHLPSFKRDPRCRATCFASLQGVVESRRDQTLPAESCLNCQPQAHPPGRGLVSNRAAGHLPCVVRDTVRFCSPFGGWCLVAYLEVLMAVETQLSALGSHPGAGRAREGSPVGASDGTSAAGKGEREKQDPARKGQRPCVGPGLSVSFRLPHSPSPPEAGATGGDGHGGAPGSLGSYLLGTAIKRVLTDVREWGAEPQFGLRRTLCLQQS